MDGSYAGYILIADEIRADSRRTVAELRQAGMKRLLMLTGDSKEIACQVAQAVGLDDMFAALLPQQKVELLETLKQDKTAPGKLAFVGDGLSDAPVLVLSDVGIAMGGRGFDAAIECCTDDR